MYETVKSADGLASDASISHSSVYLRMDSLAIDQCWWNRKTPTWREVNEPMMGEIQSYDSLSYLKCHWLTLL